MIYLSSLIVQCVVFVVVMYVCCLYNIIDPTRWRVYLPHHCTQSYLLQHCKFVVAEIDTGMDKQIVSIAYRGLHH